MLQATWVESENRVVLRYPDGSVGAIPAMTVFDAAFGGVRTVAGMEIGNPLEELPFIRFSRVPADPALRLYRAGPGTMCCERGVTSMGAFAVPPDGADQVIIDRRWHPVDTGAEEDVSAWLLTHDIRCDVPLTLRQAVALRQADGGPFRLVDEMGTLDDLVVGPAITDIQGLAATLYPYQAIGAAFLRMIGQQGIGCLLADEMGLGKTLQVITLLQTEHIAGRGPSLVVAPATLLENWRRELATFAPDIRVLVHIGGERAGVDEILLAFDVVVTSYDTLVRDEVLLGHVAWNVLALDEAQNIKNPAAQRTTYAKGLRRRVSVAVTGTPVENRLEDLWSICDFCLPGLLGDLRSFRGQYANDTADAQHLGHVVAPIILRRRVADVATDLPALIEIPQPFEMSARMAELYDTVREKALHSGPTGYMLASIRLRQLCAHPLLLEPWPGGPEDEMPKYARLLEILEEIFAQNEKVLIFAGFKDIIDLLVTDLQRRWPSCFFESIDGRTKMDDRQTIVDRLFDTRVSGALVLNPKAAGVGLNITAANHVIHYTPDWNPAVTAQASARAYRRKQTLPVTVHHLFFVDSVEESMVDRAAGKRDLANYAVTGHEGDVDSAGLLQALMKSPTRSRAGG